MIFNKVFEGKNINADLKKINHREAVRAVISRNNKVLLVHSNRGDYKFPGGGVEDGENHSDALRREVAEETGYLNILVKDRLGSVIERKVDTYDNETIFQMTSFYYICELTDEKRVKQQLVTYEIDQEFSPKWISLDDAIHQNEKMLLHNNPNIWINRENFVLKELKKMN